MGAKSPLSPIERRAHNKSVFHVDKLKLSTLENDHQTAASSHKKNGRDSGLVTGEVKRQMGQSEMHSSFVSPLKQGKYITAPDSGLQRSGNLRSGMRETEYSELDSIQKKQKILEELEEEATGEYNRKGEVDRKALLAGFTVEETITTKKKKKVAIIGGKEDQKEEK